MARSVAWSILAVYMILPGAAEAQRRKPKPPAPAPSATPAPVETAPPAPTTPPPAATPAPVEPPAAPATPPPADEPAASPSPAPAATVETHIKPAPPPAPVVRKVTTPVVVSGIIAGAGLASGVVFAVLAAGEHGKYKDKPDHDVALDGERNAFIADVSFGVAALFGLTALALYMLPDEPAPAAEPAKAIGPRSPRGWADALKGEVLRF